MYTIHNRRKNRMKTDRRNRRGFLQRSAAASAAAIAAPLVLPRHLIAGADEPGPNERVTMGFIGCGRQTYQYNIPLFVRTAGVQALAVCDVDSWRVDNAVKMIKQQYDSGKAKGTFSKVDKYVDYQDLLARDDIDAVMIATPDHWHATMALDAMKAGKDVALEKPITRTVREGQQLIAAAKEVRSGLSRRQRIPQRQAVPLGDDDRSQRLSWKDSSRAHLRAGVRRAAVRRSRTCRCRPDSTTNAGRAPLLGLPTRRSASTRRNPTSGPAGCVTCTTATA